MSRGLRREISPKAAAMALLAVSLLAAGVVAFQWIPQAWTARNAVLTAEAAAAAAWVGWRFLQAARAVNFQPQQWPESVNCHWPRAAALAAVFAGLWSWLYWERWSGLEPHSDDHHYLAMSADWATTRNNLFRPHNEHLVVPQRLFAYLVVATGRAVGLENALQLGGTLLFTAATALVFVLSIREFRSVTAGFIAVLFFAFSASYREILTWFTASLWLVPFTFLLVGMIATQRGSTWWGSLTASAVAFASCFSFSIGLIVGPLLTLWAAAHVEDRRRASAWLAALAPTVSTAAAAVLIIPRMLQWFQTDEYLGSSSREALRMFDPVAGLGNMVRVSVDFLLIRSLGPTATLDVWWAYALVFPVLPVALAGFVRRHPGYWSQFPLLGVVVAPYALVYPFRSFVPYATLQMWTRYHLIPQFGLALLLTAALCTHCPTLRNAGPQPSARQAVVLAVSAAILTALHRWFGN